jgi:hypothetical protein
MRAVPFGAARGSIANDPSAGQFTKLLELASEPFLVHIPAKVTDEQVLDTVAFATGRLGLGLLRAGGSLIIRFALLGDRLLFLLLVVTAISRGIVRVIIRRRVGRVVIRSLLNGSR